PSAMLYPLSLHDALPISGLGVRPPVQPHEHRRVLRDVEQDVLEISECVVAEHLELTAHVAAIFRRLRSHIPRGLGGSQCPGNFGDRKSTRLNSSHRTISY